MAELYIQAESGGPAWQVWPAPDTLPAGVVREGAAYLFELRDSERAVAVDLLINDTPLEALRSQQQRVARWRWEPGFHAGVVEAELRMPGGAPRRFQFTTDPDLRKLTRDDFDAMVREVLEDTFALFALTAFRRGIARQPGNRPPPLARLEFLRSRVEAIVAAVNAIARSPRHYLRPEDVKVPAHRATRATGPEIIRSFRSGAVRTETVRPSRLPPALNGRMPAHITLRQRLNSLDIPEHRQIRACLRSWGTWLSGIAELLTKAAAIEDAGPSSVAGVWAARARRMARALADAAAAGFMAEVGEGPALLRMSALYRNDPVYQRFYRLWQDMNLGLAALFGDFLQMPIARTYELYELWCFLRLLRAAVEEYGASGVDLTSLFLSDSAGGVTIATGAITVRIGGERILCFQRQYREYWLEDTRQGSLSRTMVPDLVLAGSGPGGAKPYVIVLDAKYRINDGLNDALSSIHTYRDALVQEVAGGQTERIVTAAYLLSPHVPAGLRPAFRDTPVPDMLFHPAYREKFRFGAVTLRPGMSAEDLRSCLRAIVAEAGPDS